MNERNAKSAPTPGGRAKPKDKKVTTIRDIHSWVHKGNSDQGSRKTARNTGLLTENVTEERLLFNRQLELGRERYKFLANHAYEKQKFIERQKRKNKRRNSTIFAAGTDLPRRRSLTIRIPQMDELSQSSAENENFDAVDGRKVVIEEREKLARDEVYLPKTAPSQRPTSSNKGVYLDSSRSANAKLSNVVERLPAVTVKYEVDYVPQAPRVAFHDRSNTPTLAEMGKTIVNNNTQHISPAIVSTVDMKALATNLKSANEATLLWTGKRRNSRRIIRYGETFPSSVDDPRYVALQETLVPLELESKRLDDVSDIIKRHEILQRESKSFKALNSKFSHQKFLAFLLKKELTI